MQVNLVWELHIPTDSLIDVYKALWNAGLEYDIANYGSFAMNSIADGKKHLKVQRELTNESLRYLKQM